MCLPYLYFFFFCFFFFFFFFFSSRRRHTRSKRDWSSDVCSSDLLFHHKGGHGWHGCHGYTACYGGCYGYGYVGWSGPPVRSEERRVGKECRSRWSADH